LVEEQRKIVELVVELEELCAQAERQFSALQWSEVHATIADQRRVRQALVNAIQASQGQRTRAFDEEALRRIKRIFAVREHQLKRMISFRDRIRSRLRIISRAKQARSFFRSGPAPSAGLNLLR
jgi:hypothetical protein